MEDKFVVGFELKNKFYPIYPFYVLATNRMLGTIPTSEGGSRVKMFSDTKHIYNNFGIRGFFLGFLPFIINQLPDCLVIKGRSEESFKYMEFGHLAYTFLVFNPLHMQITRMQSIKYPHKKFRSSLWDMIKNDNVRMLYKGLPSMIFGYTILNYADALAQYI